MSRDRSGPPALMIVNSTMIHGPCGSHNKDSPCMVNVVNGSCSMRYPRALISETHPQYRRRSPADGGFTVNFKGVELDNRWVVPYKHVLSRTYWVHINVEFCNSLKFIKYICKYVNKRSVQAEALSLSNY